MAQTPEQQEVVAQKAKQVGDENLADVHEVEVDTNKESVAAQVAQPREKDAKNVPVHETSVKLDEVITDPSDPRAVQIPDAGRGSLDLPIHSLDAPRVEEVFAEEAATADDSDEGEQPAAPAQS